jgi:hypothetical protein
MLEKLIRKPGENRFHFFARNIMSPLSILMMSSSKTTTFGVRWIRIG